MSNNQNAEEEGGTGASLTVRSICFCYAGGARLCKITRQHKRQSKTSGIQKLIYLLGGSTLVTTLRCARSASKYDLPNYSTGEANLYRPG